MVDGYGDGIGAPPRKATSRFVRAWVPTLGRMSAADGVTAPLMKLMACRPVANRCRSSVEVQFVGELRGWTRPGCTRPVDVNVMFFQRWWAFAVTRQKDSVDDGSVRRHLAQRTLSAAREGTLQV